MMNKLSTTGVDLSNRSSSFSASSINISSSSAFATALSHLKFDFVTKQFKADSKTPQNLTSEYEELRNEKFGLDKPLQLKRRNSTGTLYIGTTMSQQDDQATILCVCTVIRAHMVEAALSRRSLQADSSEFDVFKDVIVGKGVHSRRDFSVQNDAIAQIISESADISLEQKLILADQIKSIVPSVDTVVDFFMTIFSKSQMESECIIMALIYCERLVKATTGQLLIRHNNWKPILFACMIMASKVWDDLSMWNVDFSNVCPSFTLHRVNELEFAMLEALNYEVRVPASEYAKYYFHLRSLMVVNSKFPPFSYIVLAEPLTWLTDVLTDSLTNSLSLSLFVHNFCLLCSQSRLGFHAKESSVLKPLNVQEALRLELSTEAYHRNLKQPEYNKLSRRFHSIHSDLDKIKNQTGPTVAFEQVIHAEHCDADGSLHLSSVAGARYHPAPGAKGIDHIRRPGNQSFCGTLPGVNGVTGQHLLFDVGSVVAEHK